MKAIQVKYLAPTNNRGSRFKVSAEGVKSITRSFNHEWDASKNAEHYAYELCKINDWQGLLVSGQLPNGDYVFCFKN